MKYQHPQTIPDERRWRLPASPITRASEDELNHIEHARELRKLLIEVSQAGSAATSEERKNTIALLGDFGAGKSGIYYLLKSQTKADDAFDIVRLAAWKHDAGDLRLSMLRKVHWHLYCQQHQLSEESLSPDDIKTISKEFDDLFYSKTSRQAIELALPASADDIRSETNRRVIMEFGIAGIGALFVAFFSFVILEALGANGGLKLSIPAVAILAVGFPLRQFIARHFHHLSELSKPPTITEVRDLPRTSEQLEAIFGHFVRQWKRTSERLPVFFVDDVDRQPAARLLQVLDAVRTFTEVGDCVFVVACDETRVKSALEATRRDLKADFNSGPTQFDDYIQRYFPHCHRLPPYEAKDMVGFVERAIGKVENEHVLSYLQNEHAFPLREVLEVLIHDGIQTPRQAFGIVDAYCGKLAVAARLERTQRLNPGTVTSNPWFLARVVVIENHFPERLHELRLFPELLRWVGMRERGTVSSLEDHELAATRAWYAEMGDEETDRPPKYPELVRFVSRHHRYSAPSALPFIYLNEYGEQGAFGDAIRQELRQSLAAGQVAQLRSRLESANSPEVRRLICGVVSEFLEREELDQSGIRNALEVVPEIFDLLDGSLAHRVADDWASRVKNLSAEEQLLEVDPQKALDVLAYLPPHSAMLPELGAIVVGRGEPEPAAETDARTRLKTGLRNPEILFRAGESLTEPIKQYLSTPVESEGELAAVADYCSFVVAEPEDSLRVLELFGRPFTHRLISAIAQPAKETTEEAPAEELVSEEGAISDGLLTDTIQRLWPTMSSEDHRKTIHELCGDVRTLPVATCLLRKNWSGESELESQTFDVLTAASSADGGLVLDVAKIAVLILGDREDTRSDRTCKAADSIGERLVQSDVSWGDCIRVVDDLAEAIGPLPQSHNAIAEATVEELASDAMNEDVAESVVPYLLNHSRRLSAATQKRVVHSIMAPIEKDFAEEHPRFYEWFQLAYQDQELKTHAVQRIVTLAENLGKGADWSLFDSHAQMLTAFQTDVPEETIDRVIRNLCAYVVAQKDQPAWAESALKTIDRIVDSSPSATRAHASSYLLSNWGNLQQSPQICAAAVLKRCTKEIADEGIGGDYRNKLRELLTAAPDAVWPFTAHQWPEFSRSEQFEVFGLMTDDEERMRSFVSELETVLHEDQPQKAAALALQAARKRADAAHQWLELMDRCLDRSRKQSEAESLFASLADSWNVETDALLLRFASRWSGHPRSDGDSLLITIASGSAQDRAAVATSLGEYLPTSPTSRDSVFVDNVVRAIADVLVPETDNSLLVEMAKGLSSAGLERHEAVTEARERLKQLRSGSDADKDVWRQLDSYLPRRTIASRFLGSD